MTDMTAFLAERGLAFIRGIPPVTEEGVLLIWTGGCNALQGHYDHGRRAWVEFRSDRHRPKIIPAHEIEYWMRMPHPAFWPMADVPPAIVPERDLYGQPDDVFATAPAKDPTP